MPSAASNAFGPVADDGAEAMNDGSGSGEAASTNPDALTIGAASEALPTRPVGVFEWTRAVRDAPLDVLPRRVKPTLFVLATYADADGRRAFPSQETLGEKVGKAPDNVGRDLRIAVDRGYLIRSRPKPHSTYRYRLTVPVEPTESSGLNDADPTETSGHDPTETSAYLTNDLTSTKLAEGQLRDADEGWIL